jgi:DNA-binding NarL/FixJ family response regulator
MASPGRILIVDDNLDMLEIITHMLQSSDEEYQIITAKAAEEARKLIRDAPVDLVITDYRLEDSSGVSLAEEIRELAPDTKVVVMTAFVDPNVQTEARRAGVDYFLPKPFSPDTIRRIVSTVLTAQGEQLAAGEQEFLSPQQITQMQPVLNTLRTSVGAICALLVTTGGQPVVVDSSDRTIDANALASLVASNFAAAVEVAYLLNNANPFERIHYESSEQNICSYRLSDDLLLIVVFGKTTRQGIVQFYSRQAIADLLNLLHPLAEE